jgi:hypothetical protein
MFSRFDENTHTFLSTHISQADGLGEIEVAMPGPEGGGRWSWSGRDIAVMTVLADHRIGTAIIKPDGTVERVLKIPDASLNLVCTVWSPDDKRLACEGFDETHPLRNGIYTVNSSDGGALVRLTKTPAKMVDLPGDYSPDGTQFLFKRTTEEDPGPLMLVPTAGGGQPKPLADILVEDPGRTTTAHSCSELCGHPMARTLPIPVIPAPLRTSTHPFQTARINIRSHRRQTTRFESSGVRTS